MQTDKRSYRNLLNEELQYRIKRNPSYSLRAYARDLGLSHSSLSRVLTGAQGLSLKKAAFMAKALALSPTEQAEFETLVQSECARSKIMRDFAQQKVKESGQAVTELSTEYFKIVSDWYHFAIAELTEVRGFKSNPKWIANRLAISVIEASEAIERLLKLELIEETQSGRLKKTADFRATHSKIPNRSIQMHHQQILFKAEQALLNQPPENREFSSISFAMNSKSLSWAKEEMKKFRRALTKRLSSEKNKDRLYAFSMQMFALDEVSKEEIV